MPVQQSYESRGVSLQFCNRILFGCRCCTLPENWALFHIIGPFFLVKFWCTQWEIALNYRLSKVRNATLQVYLLNFRKFHCEDRKLIRVSLTWDFGLVWISQTFFSQLDFPSQCISKRQNKTEIDSFFESEEARCMFKWLSGRQRQRIF